MDVFSEQYCGIYQTVGYHLTERDGTPESDIRAAEERLGIALPDALRSYYLVAGGEKNFNTIFNRLRPPAEWSIDQRKLVFMEENQVVVVWGVPATAECLVDPPVYIGSNNETIRWSKEHNLCSTFLTVMVLWQGAFGGAMAYGNTALVPLGLRKKLRKSWVFAGEVNRMQAFYREGQVVCHLKWNDGWRAFYGATSPELLEQMETELRPEGELPAGPNL